MRKLLLLSFISLTTYFVNAQAVNFGAKAGANLTKVTGSSFKDEFDFGLQAGFFLEIDFNKQVGFQPELLWSQTATQRAQGFSTLYPTLVNTADDGNVKLDYLSIPLLLRINTGKALTILAGPQYSTIINKNENLMRNSENAFKNGDFAAVLGMQLNLKSIRLYGRYNIGLTNINDIDEKEKWTNQQLQLGLGIKLF